MARQPNRSRQQDVKRNISPIYVPLEPEWADTLTMQEPLMARGDFSNAWVVYERDELPPSVKRPSGLMRQEETEQAPQKKE